MIVDTASSESCLLLSDLRDDFRVVPRDTEAGVGSEVTLRCSAPKGHPAPIVRWSKDNEYLDLTSSNRSVPINWNIYKWKLHTYFTRLHCNGFVTIGPYRKEHPMVVSKCTSVTVLEES